LWTSKTNIGESYSAAVDNSNTPPMVLLINVKLID